MIKIENAFEFEEGAHITNDDDNLFVTGGSVNPIGMDLPIYTFYLEVRPTGFTTWQKFGAGVDDWTIQDNSIRTDAIDYDLKVPFDTSLLFSRAKINCELYVDGEVFVL